MKDIPEKYRKDVAIVRETAQQIVRDLNIDGFEIIFSNNLNHAFDELKTQLMPVLNKIIRGDKSYFQSILYRIDISEKDYKKLLNESNSNNFEEKLTELVIRREFQKIITRKYFSENKPGSNT